jgi:hypothetical protein
VAKRKEKDDLVMKCGKEIGNGRLGDEVSQRERKNHSVFLFLSLCHTSSPSLPFPFSLPHFITHEEKGKGRLGDEVWQRERKRKTG